MGNGLGKEDKRNKAPQVNKSDTFPQTKRNRRQTYDGIPPHLNLEVATSNKKDKEKEREKEKEKEKEKIKFSTADFKDPKLQKQLAELKLGETLGKRPPRQHSKTVSVTHSANGRDGSENQQQQSRPLSQLTSTSTTSTTNSGTESTRKKSGKLHFLHNSLKRYKTPSSTYFNPPSSASASVAATPIYHSPILPSPSVITTTTAIISSDDRISSTSHSSSHNSSIPLEQTVTFGYQDLPIHGKVISSLSEESDYMSSSVSSIEVAGREVESFRRENSYMSNGFVDPDNVVGYSEFAPKNSFRPRGRSMSDSLYNLGDNSRESSYSEIQRATENEMKKHRRFQELSKVLAERNNIIIDLQDLNFVRKVGEGAFSEVWEGYWNGVHVAIKKLKSMVDDVLFQERFLREVESLRKGNHQNVVMFFGVCLRPSCIITEFMGGGTLYDLLHKSGARMSTSLVVKLALDLAEGLLHLHSLTIVHRDLTSLNILLDELGNIKISDFGLSREKTQEGSMTMTLGGICNPRWRPPEITKNIGHYSEKVDVYSFALVVWEILTGELPFANLDGPQAAAQVAYTNLRPIIPPTCPAPLKRLIQRCWDDDAKARPDFKEIVEELRVIQYNNPMGFASELQHKSRAPSSAGLL